MSFCRSPSGERGLKCFITVWTLLTGMSLPIRGAWIEMPTGVLVVGLDESLPIRGAWIEMRHQSSSNLRYDSRSPSGERGLKYVIHSEVRTIWKRRSPSGERGLKYRQTPMQAGQPGRSPSGERGLKFPHGHGSLVEERSLPIRGAWIEIPTGKPCPRIRPVAPHPGSVD